MRVRNPATLLSAAALALTVAPLAAQERQPSSVMTGSEIDALVETRTRSVETERTALARFLAREDVREIATSGGLDVRDVRSAAATLDDDDVLRLAPMLADAEAALIGGDTVVIGTTTLIIALLVLIIILVA